MLHSLALIIVTLIGPPVAVAILRQAFNLKLLAGYSKVLSKWIIAALIVELIGTFGSQFIADPILANFFQHAIGGGVAAYCMTRHVVSRLGLKLNWLGLLVVVVAALAILGVANELFEYTLELLTHGNLLFSIDTHDTWRDLVANTSGGLTAYALSLVLAPYPKPV